MDYQSAENQVAQLQTQANQVSDGVKGLADKLQTKITDPALSRELTLDLREAALAIQKQNQQTVMLVEQMAQYIHSLETHVNAAPQQGFQTRGWASGPFGGGGGGFMSNILAGLGMGAGFGLADDVVNDVFNAL